MSIASGGAAGHATVQDESTLDVRLVAAVQNDAANFSTADAADSEGGQSATTEEVEVTDGPNHAVPHSTDGVAEVDPSAQSGHSAASGDSATTVSAVTRLFLQEVLGGILLGLALGYLVYKLMRSIDDYEIEVMITLACVMGGYSLAHLLGLSAPLAMVVAGLIVGNDTVRGTAMSKETEHYVDQFWELMDMLMNAILFVLIGLELLILEIRTEYIIASLLAIVIVLLSRYLSLILPVRFFSDRLKFAPHTSIIMTWGGLRGGISIALALSLADNMNRDLFVTVTYGVVVFSIIVQGLTVGKLANRLIGSEHIESNAATH
ncbi:MAG: hypothetical protein HKN47_16015 [Pirellulaceae bacterium]|nr:hypothetical protein [Pirellulaceae bacterium]